MNSNLEEAGTIAAEYIASLENLPAETQHLLQEIKHRETRSQELLADIQKDSAKYIRHSLRAAPASPAQALSAKDAVLPQGVADRFAEVARLAAEKERIAERLVQLITRARARLDHDLGRVLVLQGEADPATVGSLLLGGARSSAAQQVSEILRVAATASGSGVAAVASASAAAAVATVATQPLAAEAPATPAAGAAAAAGQKRRRTGAASSAGSIKLPSPAPVPAGVYGAGQRSRLSQQVHPRHSPLRGRRLAASAGPDADEDAEGEDDLEDALDEGGDAEDKELYCFCQKLSYGEMIACDNPNCRYQWFHLPCVSLKPPLPDNWFCSDCIQKKGLASAAGPVRKGRKK